MVLAYLNLLLSDLKRLSVVLVTRIASGVSLSVKESINFKTDDSHPDLTFGTWRLTLFKDFLHDLVQLVNLPRIDILDQHLYGEV